MTGEGKLRKGAKHPEKGTEGAKSGSTGGKENLFTKEQLLASGRFRDRRDIAEALLDEKELYTVKAVEKSIEDYMKGKVR